MDPPLSENRRRRGSIGANTGTAGSELKKAASPARAAASPARSPLRSPRRAPTAEEAAAAERAARRASADRARRRAQGRRGLCAGRPRRSADAAGADAPRLRRSP